MNKLRQISQAMLDDSKQDRLSAFLKESKVKKLSKKQVQELDSLLAEVHRLAAKRLRATRLLKELQNEN
ncbi:MAG: hypothetical protein ACE5I1_14710 [bacterium]